VGGQVVLKYSHCRGVLSAREKKKSQEKRSKGREQVQKKRSWGPLLFLCIGGRRVRLRKKIFDHPQWESEKIREFPGGGEGIAIEKDNHSGLREQADNLFLDFR